MTKLNFVDFGKLKTTITIEQILDAYGVNDLKRTGDQLRGCCPIHDGSHDRQFVVWPEKGSWRCFGQCKQSGDIIQLVSLLLGISNHEAALDIAERFQMVAAKTNAKPQKTAAKSKETDDGEAAPDRDLWVERQDESAQEKVECNVAPDKLKPLTYLKTDHDTLIVRGVLSDTADHFGVGYAPKGIMAGRIAIPIHSVDGTELLAYAGATTKDEQEAWKFPKGFRPELEIYNAHRLSECSDGVNQTLTIGFDPLIVLQGYEQGDEHIVALLGDKMSCIQLSNLDEIITRQKYREMIIAIETEDDRAMVLFKHFVESGKLETVCIRWRQSD